MAESRIELWERLWGNYIEKLRRIDELRAKGRYGYQLRMPIKSLNIAEKALLKEFPEADIYTDPALFQERKGRKPEMGLHTQEEQVQAVDLAADALSRGLEAAAASNLFGLSKEIGYLQSIEDLATFEGIESLANIASANQFTLLREFQNVFGELESQKQALGMHTKRERRDAFDLAVDSYHRGVEAIREGIVPGSFSEIGYLMAIRDMARKANAVDLVPTIQRQLEDLLERVDRRFSSDIFSSKSR